jgi:hypothetical protein
MVNPKALHHFSFNGAFGTSFPDFHAMYSTWVVRMALLLSGYQINTYLDR